MSLAAPITDAASGYTLNGSSWLSNLLKDGLSGYVALETIRAQKRQGDSVTTQDIPRVAAPAGAAPAIGGLNLQTVLIGVGAIAAAVTLVAFLRRK